MVKLKTIGYYEFHRDELIDIFEQNSIMQEKAKTSNDIILRILYNCDKDFKIACELTRSGKVPNRGSVIECIINHAITNNPYIIKSNFGECDLNTRKQGYKKMKNLELGQRITTEIKFATGFADATRITSNPSQVILVTPNGIWKFDPQDIIYNNHNRINAKQQNYTLATRMWALEQYIGY